MRRSISPILRGVVTRTRNVSEYMLVLALCLALASGQSNLTKGHIATVHGWFNAFLSPCLILWRSVKALPKYYDFGATICKTVRPMLSDRCLSVVSCPVLSVTLVYCGQTVGRIKMKLGTQVGLGPGHLVLDRDPAPLPQRGTDPQFSAHIRCGQMPA